jgi:DNA invertase Pin-like site-specific DNA recombinase
MDGVRIMVCLQKRDATIKVLDKPGLDLTTPIGQGILALLSGLAQDERERIVKRARDGRAHARARGVRFGPKPKLTAHQQQEARRRLLAGESSRALGRSYGVHHSTMSRLRAG